MPGDIGDPWCDPKNPRIIEFGRISEAAIRIAGGIVKTPVDDFPIDQDGMKIYVKKEFMQYTGSFKERGARFTLMMLSEEQKKIGVIAASAGNHAQALAYHGGLLGIPVTVVMPIVAPIMKVENCKKYGANVIIHGANITESCIYANKLGREKGFMYVNGYDHPDILAGQGTMGLEIMEQVPDLDAAIIPIGGGGMIAGVAKAIKTIKPNVQIIGVQPERCQGWIKAMEAGKPVLASTQPSLADGLNVPLVGVNAFATASPLIDKVVTVSEDSIAIAILRLIEMEKAVVEGGGAAGIAAVLAGLVPELAGKKIVIPLCGGNIDTTMLGRCLERGLAAAGRLVKFSVVVSDRPGGIAELATSLSELKVSIKDMKQERAWVKNDVFSVECSLMVETRNKEHALEMLHKLRLKYPNGCIQVSESCESEQCILQNSDDLLEEDTKNDGDLNKDGIAV